VDALGAVHASLRICQHGGDLDAVESSSVYTYCILGPEIHAFGVDVCQILVIDMAGCSKRQNVRSQFNLGMGLCHIDERGRCPRMITRVHCPLVPQDASGRIPSRQGRFRQAVNPSGDLDATPSGHYRLDPNAGLTDLNKRN